MPDIKSIKSKKLQHFYQEQNELIERLQLYRKYLDTCKNGELIIPGHTGVAQLGTPSRSRSASKSPILPTKRAASIHEGEGLKLEDGHDLDTDAPTDDNAQENEPTSPKFIDSDELSVLKLLGDEEGSQSQRAQWTINITFVINLILLALKLLITIESKSLSVLASAIDSVLDVISGAIIFITTHLAKKWKWVDYPTGKARMEPLGIIIFAAVTSTSAFQIVLESATRLSQGNTTAVVMTPFTLGILGAIIAIKLALYLWSRNITESASVQALAEDHRNDVIFNVFSTIFAVIADKLVWWIDPAGAILLALFIIKNWVSVCLYNVRLLTGRSASIREIQELTYFCMNFRPNDIEAVDTVRAYHVGIRLFVEVDIVLPPHIPLHTAHDIGESLQIALELLPNVERAFVHLDFETAHKIEHREWWDRIANAKEKGKENEREKKKLSRRNTHE